MLGLPGVQINRTLKEPDLSSETRFAGNYADEARRREPQTQTFNPGIRPPTTPRAADPFWLRTGGLRPESTLPGWSDR
jgi:hypothetical protein